MDWESYRTDIEAIKLAVNTDYEEFFFIHSKSFTFIHRKLYRLNICSVRFPIHFSPS